MKNSKIEETQRYVIIHCSQVFFDKIICISIVWNFIHNCLIFSFF